MAYSQPLIDFYFPRFLCLYWIPTYVEFYDFIACTEFLCMKVKHFIPIKNKMFRCPLRRPRPLRHPPPSSPSPSLLPPSASPSLCIRAPWSESLSLNNEVNNCPFVSFVPLQIIMRSLFRLIICTFCCDISFKSWIFQNPMVIPPQFYGFYGVPTCVESYDVFACNELPSYFLCM